jgi:hypothetical protein
MRKKLFLQFCDGVIDTVSLTLRDRVGKLVLGVEMTHEIEVEEPKAVAEARGDAGGKFSVAVAQRV